MFGSCKVELKLGIPCGAGVFGLCDDPTRLQSVPVLCRADFLSKN